MKRAMVLVLGVMLVFAVLSPAALAAQNQPGQGQTSTDRNLAGFGGGPHCHVLTVNSETTPFDYIRVFPSHTGHASSGSNAMAADIDCDGLPG